jgi:hypothetical protein
VDTKQAAATSAPVPAEVKDPLAALRSLSLVAATVVPERTVGATAKAKLAEYQAAQKAQREALAAPIVTGLQEGQALTDGVTYATADEASKAAQSAKRLVTSGLEAHGLRPAVRVTGEGSTFSWHVVSTLKTAKAEANETVDAAK